MVVRKRRHNMDGDIEDEIMAKIYLGWSGSQIYTYLEDKLIKEDSDRELPDLRTVQRMVKDFRIYDKSGDWSITDNEPEDARLVLDVFAEGFANKFKFSFSKALAEWIIRVKRIAPDIPSKIAFFLALHYLAEDEGTISEVKALDGYLAFAPWKEERKYIRLYKRAVAKKFVPQIPMWSFFVSELFKTDLYDPRFTGSADTIREFENDIYERSKRGTTSDSIEFIANLYEIHPEDVKDIILKYEKGDSK